MQRNGKSELNFERLLRLPDAALQLGISYPTLKQWIYKKKILNNQIAGGHHRIPQSEWTDCFSDNMAGLSRNAKEKSGT